ncbi:MAG: hypothetical protein ABTD50_08720 [Polyangiaceae bacterium]|jgi:hypothetical protein
MDLTKRVGTLRWGSFVLAISIPSASGCAPSIGDKCQVSTDCSATGSLQCDTAEPDGYCTVFDCSPNKCPDNAACVEVRASVLGCPYNDRQSPSREARNFCLKPCGSDSDCRVSEGYACVDVSVSTTTVVLDTNPASHLCMVRPYDADQDEDAAICGTNGSVADEGVDADDGGSTGDTSDDASDDGGEGAAADGAPDGSVEAASGAGSDATVVD